MDLQLQGRAVLVTGASKGIGRAVSLGFAAEGAHVAVCARGSAGVDATLAALQQHGGKAFGRALDVGDAAALAGWVNDAAIALGGVDTLVCNVSALAVGDTPDTWEQSFRVDMMHTVNAVHAAMPWLERSSQASIVIVASVSGFEIDFAAGSYGAFKAALIHYAKGLSRQLLPKGIRVNSVSPGNTYFDGGIWQSIEHGNPALFAQAISSNPSGKMGTPEDVAAGVVFLASAPARRISGTNLVIDGALTVAV